MQITQVCAFFLLGFQWRQVHFVIMKLEHPGLLSGVKVMRKCAHKMLTESEHAIIKYVCIKSPFLHPTQESSP